MCPDHKTDLLGRKSHSLFLAASKSQLLSHSFLLDSNMKVLAVALLGLPYLVVAMQLPNGVEINVDDIDPEDNVDEDQFVKDFDLPEVTDPEEKARRQAALKANEALIKEENEAYSRGEKTWFDAVNEFADLPEDEFEAEKTGDQSPPDYRTYGRGLLEPTGQLSDGPSYPYFPTFYLLQTQVLTGWTLRLSSTLPNSAGQ